MLRLVDTILLALGHYRPWARERMVYRALAQALIADRESAEADPRSRKSKTLAV